jgi:DNA repair protein SbcC/Rad50
MLPIRLELRNFLAYRSPDPLSFIGLDLACLSGPNGAGKSSLLDAMTWALWGEARTGHDNHDNLIHMGQDEMHVIFDFRQDDAIYRVVRKRSRRGRGQTTLDLFIHDEDTEQFRVISESSVRETQSRITQLLRLDYDTFVHSAFLQQGKADAFTVKTPSERKKILGEILGLTRWQNYEEQAKQSLQAIDTELSIINVRIAEIEEDESREAILRDALILATRQAEDAQQTREAAEERYAEVAGAPAAMQAAQSQLAAAQRRKRECEQDLTIVQGELEQQQRRLAAYQQVIANRDDIEEGYARLEQARQMDHDLGDKLMQRADAEKYLHDLERQYDAARAELEAQADVYRDRIREMEQILAQGEPAAAELGEVEAELDRLERRNAEREDSQAAKQALSEEAVALQTRNEALRLEMDDIKRRLTMIETVGEAICPICRQPLDEAHQRELMGQYRAEGKQRGDAFRANRARADEINNLLAAYDKSLHEIEADLVNFDALKGKQGALSERASLVQEAHQRLELEQEALTNLEQTLEQQNFSPELRSQIDELRAEIEGLGYDKETHSEAREALIALRIFEAQKRELDAAMRALPDVEANVENFQARHERCVEQLGESSAEVTALQQQIESLATVVQEAQRRQAEVTRLRIMERNATEKQIGVQQQLSAIDAARRRKIEHQKRRDLLCDDQAIYQQLREAFGQKGIPAMIIEAAIPELENATNKLLTRMTDGRMHVRFDTQRAKKAGDGVIDTLDIMISDELGTRNYDTYSGGERFRVNFALRIALSQFLARRAGARLQTLVIDEGFGSQDDMGRERLVEAINVIRQDFDLILIVTHIDELRDQFPVHIEIRKQPTGSVISVQ